MTSRLINLAISKPIISEQPRYCEICNNPLMKHQQYTYCLSCASIKRARKQAALNPRVIRLCEICGKELIPKQKCVCSAFCRVQLDRKRRGLEVKPKPVVEEDPLSEKNSGGVESKPFTHSRIAGEKVTGIEWLLTDPVIAQKHEHFDIAPLQGERVR